MLAALEEVGEMPKSFLGLLLMQVVGFKCQVETRHRLDKSKGMMCTIARTDLLAEYSCL